MLSKFFSKIYKSSPKEIVSSLMQRVRGPNNYSFDHDQAELLESDLNEIFRRFNTQNLESIGPEAFRCLVYHARR